MDTEDRDHFKTIAAVLPKLQTGSSKPTGAENSTSPRGLEVQNTTGSEQLLRAARTLFACYRKDEATNPETYIAALVAIFGDYPLEVVDYVTDPRTGISGTQKFLPAIAEVKQACEARTGHLDRMSRYAELKPVAPPPKTEVKPGQITYEQHLKLAAEGKTKVRPTGAFERGGYLGPIE